VNAVYFATHFLIEEPVADWPAEFAIITAYATTGEDWTPERNTTADEALAMRLHESKLWHRRITGYSPTTGHTEPGWTANLSVEAACKLGQEFRQDAIYYVRGDLLFVTQCQPPSSLELVGKFAERVSLRGVGITKR